jgi:hypothetical protein
MPADRTAASVFVSPLMCVESPQLLAAADEIGEAASRVLRNGVMVTAAQLRTAGELLRDGPQPIANGIRANMPGFIDREAQPRNGSLVFQIGILPCRTYRITKRGVAREVEPRV